MEDNEPRSDPTSRLLSASHTFRSGHWFAQETKSHEITVVAHAIVDIIDTAPEHAPPPRLPGTVAGLPNINVGQLQAFPAHYWQSTFTAGAEGSRPSRSSAPGRDHSRRQQSSRTELSDS